MEIIKKWLNKEYKFDIASQKGILKIIILLPILTSIYYYVFFKRFGIAYFLYFNVSDTILITHEIGSVLILFIFILLFPFLGILIPPIQKVYDNQKNENTSESKKIKNKNVLLWAFLLSCIITIVFAIYLINYKLVPISNTIIVLLGLVCFLTALILVKKIYFYSIVLIILFGGTIFIANVNSNFVKKTIKSRVFNIEDNKGNKILDIDNPSRYFIKNTSNYVFIYDQCKKEIEVFPLSEIKKISFKTNF